MKLSELETYFTDNVEHLPSAVKMTGNNILNVKMFIESHLAVLKYHSGNKLFMPYYNRLLKLYEIIRKNRELATQTK